MLRAAGALLAPSNGGGVGPIGDKLVVGGVGVSSGGGFMRSIQSAPAVSRSVNLPPLSMHCLTPTHQQRHAIQAAGASGGDTREEWLGELNIKRRLNLGGNGKD